jgi:hypothetical protein
MKKLFTILGMIGFTLVNAQTMSHKPSYINSLTNNLDGNKVQISFSAPQTINTLLVIIVDSMGHSVFLDAKLNFSGNYDKIVDLKTKGKYNLMINNDSERIRKKLVIE